VNEAVYLATGRGQRGDLSGGLQEGDWSAKTRPNIREAIKYIITSPRVQAVKLTNAQTKQLSKSFAEAYHAHLHLVGPMSRVYTFIYTKVGHICDLPEKTQEKIYDFLWEFRHGDLNSDHTDVNGRPIPEGYWFGPKQLVELLSQIQQQCLATTETSTAVN